MYIDNVINPLTLSVTNLLANGKSLYEQHTHLVNRVGLHKCNGYCLRSKSDKKKSECVKYCRFHYGEQDKITKKTPGKEIHPFQPKITEGTHPRYEGPIDHPRMIMHIREQLLTWLANCDTQVIIEDNLTTLQNYIASYTCKGGCSSQDLIHISYL